RAPLIAGIVIACLLLCGGGGYGAFRLAGVLVRPTPTISIRVSARPTTSASSFNLSRATSCADVPSSFYGDGVTGTLEDHHSTNGAVPDLVVSASGFSPHCIDRVSVGTHKISVTNTGSGLHTFSTVGGSVSMIVLPGLKGTTPTFSVASTPLEFFDEQDADHRGVMIPSVTP
ncbi:MAG: hypothetical protein QOE92_1866, partial [Chloroflexota bacterium]|nr:hypothetical protein [Chloroflexota bacterium]